MRAHRRRSAARSPVAATRKALLFSPPSLLRVSLSLFHTLALSYPSLFCPFARRRCRCPSPYFVARIVDSDEKRKFSLSQCVLSALVFFASRSRRCVSVRVFLSFSLCAATVSAPGGGNTNRTGGTVARTRARGGESGGYVLCACVRACSRARAKPRKSNSNVHTRAYTALDLTLTSVCGARSERDRRGACLSKNKYRFLHHLRLSADSHYFGNAEPYDTSRR